MQPTFFGTEEVGTQFFLLVEGSVTVIKDGKDRRRAEKHWKLQGGAPPPVMLVGL